MAASNKRGVWRVLAVLVPALLLAAGLVLAAPDNTPTAEAEPPRVLRRLFVGRMEP